LPGSEVAPPSHRGSATIFFLTLLALAVVRVLLGFVLVPVGALPVANTIVGALFLGAPILALFFAARHAWTPKLAGLFVVSGFMIQFGFAALAELVFRGHGIAALVSISISQIGLPMWCVGLGALLATLVRDRNILIPIAIFLAAFDMFLVLTPVGPTQQILRQAPRVFEAVAASIPQVQTQATGGRVQEMAHAGPADFVFLAMFFIALYRFKMRVDMTMRWVIPVLLVYLLLAVVLHSALPALVPIGLTVLIVNWREFSMTKDEKMSTALVAALGIGLLIWGMTRPRPPAEPSPSAPVQGASAHQGSPGRAPAGRPR
jgi:hypothetical protein